MKKEDILEASRNENKKKDLALIEVDNNGAKSAGIGMLLLATLYYILDIVINGKTNYQLYSVIAIYCAILYGYRAVKIKSKLSIVCAVLWTIVSVMLIGICIKEIISGK